jgi:arsenite methyltransferase
MEDLNQVLKEIMRVLKKGGWLIINDVYARNPDGLEELQKLNIDSCIRRALTREQLSNKLIEQGLSIVAWSDHTNLLTQLTVNLIMTYGSMTNFWLKSSACSNSVNPIIVQTALKQARMGYFQLIAKKAS